MIIIFSLRKTQASTFYAYFDKFQQYLTNSLTFLLRVLAIRPDLRDIHYYLGHFFPFEVDRFRIPRTIDLKLHKGSPYLQVGLVDVLLKWKYPETVQIHMAEHQITTDKQIPLTLPQVKGMLKAIRSV